MRPAAPAATFARPSEPAASESRPGFPPVQRDKGRRAPRVGTGVSAPDRWPHHELVKDSRVLVCTRPPNRFQCCFLGRAAAVARVFLIGLCKENDMLHSSNRLDCLGMVLIPLALLVVASTVRAEDYPARKSSLSAQVGSRSSTAA